MNACRLLCPEFQPTFAVWGSESKKNYTKFRGERSNKDCMKMPLASLRAQQTQSLGNFTNTYGFNLPYTFYQIYRLRLFFHF